MSLNLKAVNAPKDLVFTNRVYASATDVRQLCGQGQAPYVEIKGCFFTIEVHPKIEDGTIAFNKVQREFAKIGIESRVIATQFTPPVGFSVGCCKLEVDFYTKPPNDAKRIEVKDEDLEEIVRPMFQGQIFSTGQIVPIDYNGTVLRLQVLTLLPLVLDGDEAKGETDKGMLCSQTEFEFSHGPSGKLHVLSSKVQQRSIFRPDFNFAELGIGGLSKEFGDIFRRAFAARVFPPHMIRDLGINHVRGMLLHGPPGTGKTLIARQLAKFLKAAEPKIVNGPEILNKYVGQAEENIRNLFVDAEKEYKLQGENSQLHVVIFDEIDSICKSRGSSRDSTGVHDSIVNQLLSKIDGVDALNNLLVIGMTNRIDLIDEALLRPGRLEMHVEISLPDENGRVEILNIHTRHMREKGYLDKLVSIPALATQTKNFSGAELEGLIRCATSFALNRKVNITDISKSKDMGQVSVVQEDFEQALTEIIPAFGQHNDDFEMCIGHGITPYSADFEHLLNSCMSLVEQVRNSENTPLMTVLLHGPPGCGKTALSAHLARRADYPFIRRITNEAYVGFSEQSKVNAMAKVFDDAYKSPLSVIVLDDLERLMDFVRIGPRFSNVVLQALFALLKKQPPKAGRRLLIIGTSSDSTFLEESELLRVFNVQLNVPALRTPEHFKAVLQGIEGYTAAVTQEICAELSDRGRELGIRTLLLVAEMAVQRQSPASKEVFMDCLQNARSFD